jgi:uncharacterized cupin superfamily protein
MMRRVDLQDPQLEWFDDDPDGFRSGASRVGPSLGAKRTGATLYELPPGQSICPYHYEYGEEEALVVLEGRPTLRHPDGNDELAPWDAVAFPEGPAGAHAVSNNTAETVRVLMFSTIAIPGATVYPDSDKIGVWTGNEDDDALFRRAGKVTYFEGEPGT